MLHRKISFLLLIFSFSLNSQSLNDFLKISIDNSVGSARFESMGGAFGALGGDLSAINVNAPRQNPFTAAAVSQIQAHAHAPILVKNIHLTPREWQVLGFIYLGYRNQKIANIMGVAPTTIKSHIRNVYQKLGLGERNEALRLSETLVALVD